MPGPHLAEPTELAACRCCILWSGGRNVAIVVQQVCTFHLVGVSRSLDVPFDCGSTGDNDTTDRSAQIKC